MSSHITSNGGEMSEPEEQDELEEPRVADVPEPDQDDEDEEEEAGVATPPGPAEEPAEASVEQGVTQEQWEERHHKADSAFKGYVTRIGRIYEEDALAYLPCPLCSDTPAGFIHPANAGKFPDEVVGAVMMLLGQTASGNVKPDPYSTSCDTCDGWGVVRTGSHVPNQETRTCLDCKGLGFQPTHMSVEGKVVPMLPGAGGENGMAVPAATGAEAPELEALRLRGYTIVPPLTAGG